MTGQTVAEVVGATLAGLGADCVFDKSNEIDQLLLYCKELAGEADLLSFSDTLQ